MLKADENLAGLGVAIERLPGEPPDAYQAFLKFAWLQTSERSIERTSKETGYTIATCQVWSMNYKWSDRATEVDAQRWLHEHLEREKLQFEDNKRFVEANREIKERSIATARKMLRVADNLLETADLAGETVETGHVITSDNRSVPTYTTINMKSKISDIPRLVDTAVKVARLAADLPTEIIDPVQRVAKNGNLRDMSDEELEAALAENRERVEKLGAGQILDTIG